jgi:hypothetical protein
VATRINKLNILKTCRVFSRPLPIAHGRTCVSFARLSGATPGYESGMIIQGGKYTFWPEPNGFQVIYVISKM